ncbi:Septin 4 [Cichlidogyrus casuarinus]|uniref:Septin n=1 Tax=Cichlidogyrus casuarinus TaxID=1844966 RepID=A0ABD2PWX9_9PLAT
MTIPASVAAKKYTRNAELPRMTLKELQPENKDIKEQQISNQVSKMPDISTPKSLHKSEENLDRVGFANLPNQIHAKVVRKGFKFNMILVGPSGIGKSTFLNSLLLTDFLVHPQISKETFVSPRITTARCKENNIALDLRVVDFPGFGDFIDNSQCWKPVLDYVEGAYDQFMMRESKIDRSLNDQLDHRVHVCLYFIQPTSCGLSALDLQFLLNLHSKVNIILIIGRSDLLTREECDNLKQRIRQDLEDNQINIYQFPDIAHSPNDELSQIFSKNVSKYQSPFAVIASNHQITLHSGKRVRGREYPWGRVEIENLDHSDFAMLRHLLICLSMHVSYATRNLDSFIQDLVDSTHFKHYEKYRSEMISNTAQSYQLPLDENLNPMSHLDAERRLVESRIHKMEVKTDFTIIEKVTVLFT